jgi:fructuronate reductase
MLKLSRTAILDKAAWQEAGIRLPAFDIGAVRKKTVESPKWVHFGAGNIFRGFIAELQQRLLDSGKADTGIVAVETYDFEIIEKIYSPYDNLSLLVIMNPDGSLDKTVIASVCEGLAGDKTLEKDWSRLTGIFENPSLQMASFTITEKGYSLKDMAGELFEVVKTDMKNGPENPAHVMSKVTALTYARYKKGAHPFALVSMDNCSHNGEKLHEAIETIARVWIANKFIEPEFLEYINDPRKVSFPWSMIDKITPRPSDTVKNILSTKGFGDTDIVCTSKNTYIAPFVNAEGPQYLVIEDLFPNGRMPLESVGVYFTDRTTVEKVERMKVCTCLNPLHTALAVFGCLLGYTHIAEEMKNPLLRKLVEKIGYDEGLPVVTDPGILNPKDFIREVIEKRLPNPYIPDMPQRIASDTSQKVGIRFGETIKAYRDREGLDPSSLTFIPFAIAGWCRYLVGIDDAGKEMPLSSDPMLPTLRSYLAGVTLGTSGAAEKLRPILSNAALFGVDLYSIGLGGKIESWFTEMISEKNSVAKTLLKVIG